MNANLNPQLTTDATSLFKEYRDVFAFSYEDLRGIPEHIATHRIELDTAISPCHQARYCMNPNYAKAVKEDLEKLLKAGFIEPVDQATWLSPIVVVPKKNGKLRFVWISDASMLLLRRTRTPYHSQMKSLIQLLDMPLIPSLTVFPATTKSTFMQTIGTRPPSSPNGAHMYG